MKRAPAEILRRDLLDVLEARWPAWHSCSQLAALVHTRTVWLWPLLFELRAEGRLESQEIAWEAKQIVYEVWRLDIAPADLARGSEGVPIPNPFTGTAEPPVVSVPKSEHVEAT